MEIEATTFQKKRSLSKITMHKQSRTLTKSKPKIRIIHIFAPEIIQTDVSNFREIVQQLTGKEDHHDDLHNQKGLKRNPRSRGNQKVQDMSKSHEFTTMEKLREHDRRFCINSEEEEEMMMWKDNVGESSGGFLNGFGEFDGFIQELGEFPYLPFTIDPTVASSSSSYLHGGLLAESHQFA